MRQILLYSLSILFVNVFQILAQESGWVEKDGYKQQLYKTGEIKQLLYTSTGDTIITVTKDSVWHRYLWEAKSGKLLNTKTILTKNYINVYGIWFTPYAKTYTVAAQDQDKHTYIWIHRSINDSLIGKVKVSLENMYNCFAYYYENDKALWIGRSTKYVSPSFDGSTISGDIGKYIHSDSTFTPMLKIKGSPQSFAASYDGKIATWNSITVEEKTYRTARLIDKFEQYHYRVNVDSIESFKIPTARSAFDFVSFPLETNLQYSSNISPLGTHEFNNFLDIFQHTHIPSGLKIKDSNINNTLYRQSSSNEDFLILPIGSRLFIYDISSRKFIDSISLGKKIIHASISTKNNISVYLNDNQLINLSAPSNNDSVQSIINISHPIRYQDSTILFNSIKDSSIIEYIWDLGNSKTTVGQYVSNSYQNPGKYNVKLSIIRRKSNIVDTVSESSTVTILPLLKPNFESDKNYGLTPLIINFRDLSQGAITKKIWDFGNGIKDTNSNPIYIFKGNGYYNISLTIYDALSYKTITKFGYITTGDFPLFTLEKSYNTINKAQSYSLGQYQKTEYNNTFRAGIVMRDSLFAYFQECLYEHYDEGGSSKSSYKLGMDIRNTAPSPYSYIYHSVEFGPYPCDYPSKVKIIPYRKSGMVTSTIIQTKFTMNPRTYESLYFTKKGEFAPSGWSHDFNAVFLPDGTDIFLFRNKQSNLQFFYKDTSAFQRIDFATQFSDIFALNDSSTIALFSNPTFDVSDSTHSYELTFIDNKAHTMKTLTIPKTINVALQTLFPLNNGKFLVAGFTAERNDKRQIINKKGYIALININGFIEWEKVIPTYEEIRTIQKHPNNYFAALGLPVNKQKHGFIALRENGNVLADFRLFNADDSFYPNDFIIGNNEHDIWFIGKQYVSNQGERATLYSCLNPVTPTTDIDSSQQDLSPTTQDFSVSPNPASDIIYLHNHSGMVTLYDLMGNIILHSDSSTLDCSQLIQGIYVIKSEKRHIKPIMIIIQK